MKDDIVIDMFDRVRIRKTDLTRKANLSDLVGVVYGVTTPSVTLGMEDSSVKDIIGELKEDVAYNVYFEETHQGIWFSPQLVEFVDHNPGCEMFLGGKTMVRQESGEWMEKETKEPSRWDKFLKLFGKN
jgi:hypothetical protein